MLGFTVARVYCNCATNEAFKYVWEGFFKAIEKATGRKVQFKVFNETRNILCVILNMEVAQVQGLGAVIICLNINNPLVSKITEVDPNIIVQYLIKLCFMHWERWGFLSIVYSWFRINPLNINSHGKGNTEINHHHWSWCSINFQPLRTQLISLLGRNFVRNTQVGNYAVCSVLQISSIFIQ